MRTCRDCHFLAKVLVHPDGRVNDFTWDDNDRANGWIRMDLYEPECHKQVWSMRLDPMLAYGPEVQKNRRKCRFFYPYTRSMSFPTASESLEIERTNRRNKIAIIGIAIGGIIAVIGWLL